MLIPVKGNALLESKKGVLIFLKLARGIHEINMSRCTRL